MPILELRNVYKNYGKVEAVKNLSLVMEKGDFAVILGPSGAGKTSTLKMVSGLEPVTKGEIYVNEKLINNLEPRERNVAMVFEEYALYPHLTVFENLASPLRAVGKSEEEIRKRVYEVAEMLQIKELLDRRPGFISGGQKQRVSLGRALIKDAVVYLMDEPIAHLDAKLRHQMRTEFKRIQHDTGIPILYTTHDFREALSLGTKVIVLNKGEVIQYSPPEEVFDKPANVLVASLVGEPPMNIIRGKVSSVNGRLSFFADGVEIPVDERILAAVSKKKSLEELLIGIRPFDLHIAQGESNLPKVKNLEVYVTELLGNVNIISIYVGKNLVKVRVSKEVRFEIGEKVDLEFDPSKVHLFDPHTSERIDLEGNGYGTA